MEKKNDHVLKLLRFENLKEFDLSLFLTPVMDQNSNGSSASSVNINGSQDSMVSAYQLAVQAQLLRWVTAMQNPYATQLQNSGVLQQPQHSNLSNEINGAFPRQLHSSFRHLGPIHANITDDVFRMIHPVGSSPNDDNLLAQALHDSATNGTSYRQAIEGLHGINNHPAHLWKDYYLDHRPRINTLVSRIENQHSRPVKKSFLPAPALNSKDSYHVAPAAQKARGRPPSQNSSKINAQNKFTGRTTINSITAHPPPPTDPYAHITIPDPPSREPSPPSEVVAFSQKGNSFTQSDTDFMLKFISWELQRNPTLNKSNLSHKLEAKAPHHPFSSWMQHIRAAGPIVDKMIAIACGEEEDEFSEIESNTKIESKIEFDVAWQLRSGSGAVVAEFDEDLADDDDINMGLPGKNYTAADRRLLAKYIATVDDWNYQDDSVRFAKFHERFPHRALRSWSRYYARNEEGIDRLAKKYKEQTEESVCNRTSRGQLSWASSNSNASLPSALKRKFGLTQTDLG